MSRLALDCPLAKLNPSRVPILPVRAIWICFDTDHKTYRVGFEVARKPFRGWFQSSGVDVRIYPSTRKKDKIAEEICFEDIKRESLVRFEDGWYCSVQMPYQMGCNLIRDDLDKNE